MVAPRIDDLKTMTMDLFYGEEKRELPTIVEHIDELEPGQAIREEVELTDMMEEALEDIFKSTDGEFRYDCFPSLGFVQIERVS